MSTNLDLPPEYQAQIDAALRKKKLAEMLQAQAMGFKGPEQIGPVAAKTSPLALLANLGTGYFSGQLGQRADADITGAKQKFSDDQIKELQRIQTLPESEGLLQGAASKYPLVQKQTQAARESRQKRLAALIPVVGNRDPNLAVGMAASNDFPTQPIPPKLETVNGQRVPENTPGDFRDQYGAPFALPGSDGKADLYQRVGGTGKLSKLDNAPKTTVTAIGGAAGKAESEFAKTVGRDNAELLKEARNDAIRANKSLGMVSQMEQLDKQGVFSGPAAPVAVVLSSFAQSIGVPVDSAKLANSEAYQQQFAKQIASFMLQGSVGRSMTDADRKRFEESFPALIQSPEGRAQIYQQMRNSAAADTARHQSFQKYLTERYPEEAGVIRLNPVDAAPGPGVNPGITKPQSGMPAGTKQIKRTGTEKSTGRKVIEYTDGTRSYE